MDSPAPDQPEKDPNSLSADDIKSLTDQLSQEIDQEIKKQFADTHGLDTQQKVNQVLKQVAATQPKPEQPEAVVQPKPPQPTPETQPDLSPPKDLSADNYVEASLDPLQASIQAAFVGLKEGDKIGEWTLKKIYSTSFGHNKSSFYELENQSGAKWTLNPEEVKELLKTNLAQSPQEPSNLSPKPSSTAKIEQMPKLEVDQIKPKIEIKTEPIDEPKAEPTNTELSKEQIAFLTKLHSEPKLWNLFISLQPGQVEKVHDLYQKGDLDQLGIAAHPLLDQLSNPDFGEQIVIKKGATITSLLSEAKFQLTFQPADSLILGVHIIANSASLKQTLEKVRSSGVSTPDFPTETAIIKLVKDGLGGNNQAYQTMLTILTFLPSETKFRIFSPEQIESLKKYF